MQPQGQQQYHVPQNQTFWHKVFHGYKGPRQALWIILGGWFNLLVYTFLGIGWIISIIGIPWGVMLFRYALFMLNPVGKKARPVWRSTDYGVNYGPFMMAINSWKSPLTWIANIVFVISQGWEMLLLFLVLALIQAITVVGLGNAKQYLELIPFALVPFGFAIVPDDRMDWVKSRAPYPPVAMQAPAAAPSFAQASQV